ncbi:hypothetical protein Fmac_011570 [Flemingia macrophylla]|uniref:Uncharacterized protein n=1 Tax=Flemingia macrophylla TaxID=520843 RepID=A0ABD1MMU5_9FABA
MFLYYTNPTAIIFFFFFRKTALCVGYCSNVVMPREPKSLGVKILWLWTFGTAAILVTNVMRSRIRDLETLMNAEQQQQQQDVSTADSLLVDTPTLPSDDPVMPSVVIQDTLEILPSGATLCSCIGVFDTHFGCVLSGEHADECLLWLNGRGPSKSFRQGGLQDVDWDPKSYQHMAIYNYFPST